ncbi:MAG TPA: glycosyltransferase [Aggregatilineales bacterium]|nr:glycosyltransferase [Anaerolineales bacterium]HRE47288.1 glycosyltransferase [Aggregatilineales bacterium]
MTKVLNVISRLNIGGIAPYLIPLTTHLRSLGFDAQLVAGNVGKNEGDMAYLTAKAGIEVISVPRLGRDISPLRDLATVRDLFRLFRRERPDIVHTHTAKAGFAGRVAAKMAGVPYIFHTYHGHVFSGYFSPRKTAFYKALDRFTAALSTHVITVANYLRRDLTEVHHIAAPHKVSVLIPGYELGDLYALQRGLSAFRDAHAIPLDAPLVGIVGRLVPIKNHDLFLQAAVKVSAGMPNTVFAIVGDGERRAEIEAQVDAFGLREHVRFTGWQTDLPPIYSDLDCLVLCSHNEGLPSSIIEALVTGVPVVATAVGGVVDLLAKGRGELIPAGDAQALAAGVIDALRNPTVKDGAVTRRGSAFALYDMRPSAERVAAFYREWLGK